MVHSGDSCSSDARCSKEWVFLSCSFKAITSLPSIALDIAPGTWICEYLGDRKSLMWASATGGLARELKLIFGALVSVH